MPRYLIIIIIAVFVGFLAYGTLRTLLGSESVTILSLIALVIVGVVAYRNLQTNRKVTHATPEQRAEALQFTAPAGKAALYVFRNQFVGRAVGVSVLIDDREVAQIKSPRFIRITLTPGKHRIAGFTGTNKRPGPNEGDVITAKAGDVLIYKCEVQSQMVGAVVKFIPQPNGRGDVQKISRMVIADIAEV